MPIAATRAPGAGGRAGCSAGQAVETDADR